MYCFSLGAVGQSQNALSALDTILMEFNCMGSESNLNDCPKSSLSVCASGSVAAISCQGEVVSV